MTDQDTTILPTDDLRAVFDIAVGSMDFGSGCFDSDDVAALRRVAAVLGVNPMDATPIEFVTQYPHAFKENHRHSGPRAVREEFRRLYADKCDYCDQPESRHPDTLIRRP